jgi:uncharacterized protein YoaH (UPF0181 family)
LAFTDITERLASEKAIRERDAAEIRAVESRAAQQRNLELADQQAALRRVATLVARGASPSEVFAAVSNELARVLHVVNAGLLRFEPDGTGFVVAVQYEAGITEMPVTGERIPLAGDDVGARVLHTGRPARIDNHAHAPGPEAERIRNRASTRSSEYRLLSTAAFGARQSSGRGASSPCRRTPRRESATSPIWSQPRLPTPPLDPNCRRVKMS